MTKKNAEKRLSKRDWLIKFLPILGLLLGVVVVVFALTQTKAPEKQTQPEVRYRQPEQVQARTRVDTNEDEGATGLTHGTNRQVDPAMIDQYNHQNEAALRAFEQQLIQMSKRNNR